MATRRMTTPLNSSTAPFRVHPGIALLVIWLVLPPAIFSLNHGDALDACLITLVTGVPAWALAVVTMAVLEGAARSHVAFNRRFAERLLRGAAIGALAAVVPELVHVTLLSSRGNTLIHLLRWLHEDGWRIAALPGAVCGTLSVYLTHRIRPAGDFGHSRKWWFAVGAVVTLSLVAVITFRATPWEGELNDPAVESLWLTCGTDDEPSGTGMPAWPEGNVFEKYYTRQLRDTDGDLMVEVWKFGNPGYVLTRVDRIVKGNQIVVKARWAVPPDGAVAACYSKMGARITFHGLPNQPYTVIAE